MRREVGAQGREGRFVHRRGQGQVREGRSTGRLDQADGHAEAVRAGGGGGGSSGVAIASISVSALFTSVLFRRGRRKAKGQKDQETNVQGFHCLF